MTGAAMVSAALVARQYGAGPARRRPCCARASTPWLRRERGPDVGPHAGHREAPDHVQPRAQQLRHGRRPLLLDRRSRGRPPSWPALARAVGHPEWITDPRFADGMGRAVNAGELIALLDEIFATRPLRRVGRRLRRRTRPVLEPGEQHRGRGGRRAVPRRPRWSRSPTRRAACPCWPPRSTSTGGHRSPAGRHPRGKLGKAAVLAELGLDESSGGVTGGRRAAPCSNEA